MTVKQTRKLSNFLSGCQGNLISYCRLVESYWLAVVLLALCKRPE